jgi:hypothetical protein
MGFREPSTAFRVIFERLSLAGHNPEAASGHRMSRDA